MKNEYQKKLSKLENGYILEYNRPNNSYFNNEKIIFSTFFNDFNNYYLIQTLRDNLDIRKDKWQPSSNKPHITDIFPKTISETLIFKTCFDSLKRLVKEDMISDKSFNQEVTLVERTIQDYFHNELHTHLSEPKFNSYINIRRK